MKTHAPETESVSGRGARRNQTFAGSSSAIPTISDYVAARRRTINASIAAERLSGNKFKEECERCALAEITALEIWLSKFQSPVGIDALLAELNEIRAKLYNVMDGRTAIGNAVFKEGIAGQIVGLTSAIDAIMTHSGNS